MSKDKKSASANVTPFIKTDGGKKGTSATGKNPVTGQPKQAKDAAGRPKLPPLPRAPKKAKPQVECGCGCGELTRSKYVPGHDSYLRGMVLRIERNICKYADFDEKHHAAIRRLIKERKEQGITGQVHAPKKADEKKVEKPAAPTQDAVNAAVTEGEN